MDDMWTLLLLSLTMLIGCYLAGCIPLAITLSEEKLKLITVLGAGLLVGTALAVIIPEGVHTLYAKQEGHTHVHKEVDNSIQKVAEKQGSEAEHTHIHSTELHTWIGVALVLGFIFMLLIDQLSGGSHSHVAGKSETGGAAKDSVELEAGSRHSQNLLDSESGVTGKVPHRRNITATLGLVVHAAADGVALGAAATTSQTHVEMIVFIAIMLHKAPAAFGLVSFLLHAGFERNRIRKHLAAFSAAAPLLAVITYFGLSQHDKQILTDVNATGIAMLFSAGTFLYVATVHILPELASMGTSRTQAPDGTTIVREQKGFTKLELSVMIVGSLLPLILSFGHHH